MGKLSVIEEEVFKAVYDRILDVNEGPFRKEHVAVVFSMASPFVSHYVSQF